MEFLNKINKKFEEKSGEIENWIEQHSKEALVPLYTSVDLRISKYKITPVDTNVFPAGFNNLSDYYRGRTASLFKQYLRRKYPKYRNILLIPELNTRNLYYWENVYVLKSILESVGFRVEIGIVSDELQLEKANFKSISGKEIQAYKVVKIGFISPRSPYLSNAITLINPRKKGTTTPTTATRQEVAPSRSKSLRLVSKPISKSNIATPISASK